MSQIYPNLWICTHHSRMFQNHHYILYGFHAPIIPHHSLIAFEMMSSAAWFDPLVVSPPRRHPSPCYHPHGDLVKQRGMKPPCHDWVQWGWQQCEWGMDDSSWLLMTKTISSLFHHPFFRTISLSHYLSLPFLAMLQGCPVFQPISDNTK
jgi:hypothetical protein